MAESIINEAHILLSMSPLRSGDQNTSVALIKHSRSGGNVKLLITLGWCCDMQQAWQRGGKDVKVLDMSTLAGQVARKARWRDCPKLRSALPIVPAWSVP